MGCGGGGMVGGEVRWGWGVMGVGCDGGEVRWGWGVGSH